MLGLKDREWAVFPAFGDGGHFAIQTTSSSIDGVRIISGGDLTYPYVTRSDANNGIARFVDPKNKVLGYDKAGSITVGLDTQTVFFQPYDFVTGQNVQIITGNTLTRNVAIFLLPIFKSQMRAKFNWGGNGATLGRMKKLQVMLPIDAAGEPDWQFMEDYVREREAVQIEQCREFLERKLGDIKREGVEAKLPRLSEKTWKEFIVGDVFKILSGKRLEARNRTEGTRPFIGALDNSNGIAGFVGDANDSLDSNVLGVNYNGNGVCLGFYHAYECLFSDDVKRFHLKGHEDNEFVLLFMKTIIQQQRGKFGYLYKFNAARMDRQRIMLPVDDNNEPDWTYMEAYTRELTSSLIIRELNYLGARVV